MAKIELPRREKAKPPAFWSKSQNNDVIPKFGGSGTNTVRDLIEGTYSGNRQYMSEFRATTLAASADQKWHLMEQIYKMEQAG